MCSHHPCDPRWGQRSVDKDFVCLISVLHNMWPSVSDGKVYIYDSEPEDALFFPPSQKQTHMTDFKKQTVFIWFILHLFRLLNDGDAP